MKNKKYPAIKGIQAGKTYYTIMVPLGELVDFFPDLSSEMPPEEVAQRRLNESRVPKIRDYILNNPGNYVFSSMAASMDGEYEFVATTSNTDCGELIIKNASLLLNDGQHRKAGIVSALKVNKELADETIAMVLFQDKKLSRSKQIFADLNKNAVKASNSKSESFDSRDPISIHTQSVVEKVDFFRKYTDKETDNLGKNSKCLFTFHILVQANGTILGNRDYAEEDQAFLVRFWNAVSENMTTWNQLNEGSLTKKSLKEDYISTQGTVIKALGIIGRYFYDNPDKDMDEYLKHLQEIDWSRLSPRWKDRTIRKDGKILTNRTAVVLTSNRIKKDMGLKLDKKESDIEKKR